MLIIGAKGFAREVLEIFHQQGKLDSITFYDDINPISSLYGQFAVINDIDAARKHFADNGSKFTIGIGNPKLRHSLYNKFTALGGEFSSSISPRAIIGSYDVEIGPGSNVLCGAVFSNSTKTGKGCIVYYNAIITHDCVIGDFVEISPAAQILGRCTIGSYSQIGSNATILPDVIIGENCIIGAGSVVTKDIPDNSIAFGVPCRVIKKNS